MSMIANSIGLLDLPSKVETACRRVVLRGHRVNGVHSRGIDPGDLLVVATTAVAKSHS